MDKKEYMAPELQEIKLSVCSIICTSGIDDDGGDEGSNSGSGGYDD